MKYKFKVLDAILDHVTSSVGNFAHTGSVRGSPNGTIGNFTNGTIGSSQWCHWLTNGTVGLPMVPIVPLGESMVPLALPLVQMVLTMVPLVKP